MEEAVTILQKKFLANPEPKRITNDEEIKSSELLAKEGVLKVIAENTFEMASSLLRSIIIRKIINKRLPSPLIDVPLHKGKKSQYT